MTLAEIRDIAIVALAVVWLAVGAILVLVGLRLLVVLGLLADRLDLLADAALRVLDSARDAAGAASESAKSLRGTAQFVSETVVSPVIGIAAAASAASRFVETLVRPRGGRQDGTVRR